MAAFVPYYLRLLDARGEVVESFAPAPLTVQVRLAVERVADFDSYNTVLRVLRLTGGLYARPFLPVPAPAPVAKGKRKPAPAVPAGPLIVHVVSANLYHVEQKAA